MQIERYVSRAITVCIYSLLAAHLTADEVTKWNEIAGKASFTSGLAAILFSKRGCMQ